MKTEWFGVGLSVLAIIVIPFMIAIARSSARWARVEAKLDNVVSDVKEMKDSSVTDRAATNDRLTWLERNLWQMRGSKDAVPSESRRRELPGSQLRNRRGESNA